MVAATVHLDQFHPPAGEALESANLRRIDDVLHDTGDHSGRLARACSACRTSGPRGWRPAQGHRRPRSRGATTLSGKYTTPPRPRLPGNCSTTPVIAGVRGAICGHVMALDVHSSRPGRRSDDGQTILKAALKGRKLGFHLGKLVELRGFEPRTSCMPSQHSVTGMVRDVLIHHDGVQVGPGRRGMVATGASYRPRPRSDLAIPPTGA